MPQPPSPSRGGLVAAQSTLECSTATTPAACPGMHVGAKECTKLGCILFPDMRVHLAVHL